MDRTKGQHAFLVPVTTAHQVKMLMVQTMRTQTQVDILYVRANGSLTLRTVEPFGFTHNNDGDAYVRSMDHQSGQVRSWRLDRIIGFLPSENPFTLEAPESADRVAA